MSEEDGVRLLGSLRAVEVPASGGVSVERAIRAGRRTKSLRVAAAGLVVLVVAGVLPFLVKPGGGPPPVAATTFDPFVRTISVGSLPGLKADLFTTGRTSQSISLRPEGGGDRMASVNVHTAGAAKPMGGEPVADVNGRRALWNDTYLAIEWEPDAWAFVQVQGFPDPMARSRALAESLRFDGHVQIKVPYTVQTSWQIYRVVDDAGDVQLEFENFVRVSLRGGVGFAQGDVPQADLDALAKSVQRADPPVTNPFR
ncbi:hypothetical protein ACFWN2_35325 [Lentzea sp. NPDC058436]|uniref:hypothetical protein n=1 Tax=Lentzea sp. NPDC058436 TaxID=3346499 RepID=UPI00365F8CB2